MFKLSKAGKETVLYAFTGGADGGFPWAGLTPDAAGNLYGTTSGGGAFGGGTVFKLGKAGKETVLYSFCSQSGCNDGAVPQGSDLILAAKGTLYGTTYFGGPSGQGTVFKLSKTGKETVLHSFTGGADGAYPFATLILDAAGNLYGTTAGGGPFNYGTVFKLGKAGKETVLHSFAGGAEGYSPAGYLAMDTKGNLYGTAGGGGTHNVGTVWVVNKQGTLTVLHSFAGAPSDGASPNGGVILDGKGNLYGDTLGGGASGGYGTVYEMNNKGTITLLHSFAGGSSDGVNPWAVVIRGAKGNLYGDTLGGGPSGAGTVWQITK